MIHLENLLFTILDHITNCMEGKRRKDFAITKMSMVSSQVTGITHKSSDLDIAIEYKGNMREDDVFNLLKGVPLKYETFVIDFVPLSVFKGNSIDNDPRYLPIISDELLIKNMISIYFSDIYNKDVLLKIDNFYNASLAMPDCLERFFPMLNGIEYPGIIIEPLGRALLKLNPSYFLLQEAKFYKERTCDKKIN